MPLKLNNLLKIMLDRGASDLHIHAYAIPQIRINSQLVALDYPEFTPEQSKDIVYPYLAEDEIKDFEKDKELDTSFSDAELSARFRMNVFYHKGGVCAAIRAIPKKIPDFSELGLPEQQMVQICRSKRGLVLMTGATGSGKSTTLASIINRINAERNCHIITVEDPVEFIYTNNKSIITQREIGKDTNSFSGALKYILRQDPDVILIGEMRDLETVQAAMNMAETGHLVFATLHTSDCVQTINRIIDMFPYQSQSQARTQLSYVLLSTISQQLLAKSDNSGLCLASELMIATFGVRAMIREEKVHQIFSLIQTGLKEGMYTMNHSLYELYKKGLITYQEASAHITDTQDFKRFFQGPR
ncbi:MAG: type IV pilus twitching motility protein PilT [Candidatus Omnitrophota bacterium]